MLNNVIRKKEVKFRKWEILWDKGFDFFEYMWIFENVKKYILKI